MEKGTQMAGAQRADCSVALVGVGPWGLCVLERLVTSYRALPGGRRGLRIHVIDPGPAGSGVFSANQPDYFILNTPCGQHNLHPFPDEPAVAQSGRSFLEWVRARGYRWVDGRCVIGEAGREISGADFLPRRLMGEYLEWFYEELLADTAAGLQIVRHRNTAIDVQALADGRQRVVLDNHDPLVVDHVVLTTGHTKNHAARRFGRHELAPYPVEQFGAIKADQPVAVAGMGLVALDVVTALTTGRGGCFRWQKDHLRYYPSGREPNIYLFSRSGRPYCAKSSGAADPTGEYQPVICTETAVRELRGLGPVDARRDFLPLVFAEMEVAFSTQAALLEDGAEAAEAVRGDLAQAWKNGDFHRVKASWQGRYGPFCAADHFFGDEQDRYLSAKDYETQVYDWLQADIEEAVRPRGTSPTKRAYEVLRVLRDTMRALVEFRGLTLESYLDFQSNIRNRITRLVAGPPVSRSQELLALLDARVVQIPFGPNPSLETAGGALLLRSRRLDQPVNKTVEWLIQGHLDDPTCHQSSSTLLANLYRRGRLRQLYYESTPVGSIDLSTDFHPLNSLGESERRLWIFGALSEGVRHFTHYIPSPKSRVRAFIDAQVCVDAVLAGVTEPVTDLVAHHADRRSYHPVPVPRPAYSGVA